MNKAAQQLGKLGGKAGTGSSKRRSKAHYKKISKLGAEARRQKYYVQFGEGRSVEVDTIDGKTVAIDGVRPRVVGLRAFRKSMRLKKTKLSDSEFRRKLIAIRAKHRFDLSAYHPKRRKRRKR